MRSAKAGLFILTATATIAICFPLAAQIAASTPEALVTRFCTLNIRYHKGGFFLQGEAKGTMRPLLSEEFLRRVDDGEACDADFWRQNPDPTMVGKPPFAECCLFSSAPEGMATSFRLVSTTVLRDGRYRVLVKFVQRSTLGVMRWWDAAIVMREGNRLVIDNVVFDADRKPAGYVPKPATFYGCQGRRWVGGH